MPTTDVGAGNVFGPVLDIPGATLPGGMGSAWWSMYITAVANMVAADGTVRILDSATGRYVSAIYQSTTPSAPFYTTDTTKVGQIVPTIAAQALAATVAENEANRMFREASLTGKYTWRKSDGTIEEVQTLELRRLVQEQNWRQEDLDERIRQFNVQRTDQLRANRAQLTGYWEEPANIRGDRLNALATEAGMTGALMGSSYPRFTAEATATDARRQAQNAIAALDATPSSFSGPNDVVRRQAWQTFLTKLDEAEAHITRTPTIAQLQLLQSQAATKSQQTGNVWVVKGDQSGIEELKDGQGRPVPTAQQAASVAQLTGFYEQTVMLGHDQVTAEMVARWGVERDNPAYLTELDMDHNGVINYLDWSRWRGTGAQPVEVRLRRPTQERLSYLQSQAATRTTETGNVWRVRDDGLGIEEYRDPARPNDSVRTVDYALRLAQFTVSSRAAAEEVANRLAQMTGFQYTVTQDSTNLQQWKTELVRYQNDDSRLSYYTTDTDKVGTPVLTLAASAAADAARRQDRAYWQQEAANRTQASGTLYIMKGLGTTDNPFDTEIVVYQNRDASKPGYTTTTGDLGKPVRIATYDVSLRQLASTDRNSAQNKATQLTDATGYVHEVIESVTKPGTYTVQLLRYQSSKTSDLGYTTDSSLNGKLVPTIIQVGQNRQAAEEQASRLTQATRYVWTAKKEADGTYTVVKETDPDDASKYLTTETYAARLSQELHNSLVTAQNAAAHLTQITGNVYNTELDTTTNKYRAVDTGQQSAQYTLQLRGVDAQDYQNLLARAAAETQATGYLHKVKDNKSGIEQVLVNGQPVSTLAMEQFLSTRTAASRAQAVQDAQLLMAQTGLAYEVTGDGTTGNLFRTSLVMEDVPATATTPASRRPKLTIEGQRFAAELRRDLQRQAADRTTAEGRLYRVNAAGTDIELARDADGKEQLTWQYAIALRQVATADRQLAETQAANRTEATGLLHEVVQGTGATAQGGNGIPVGQWAVQLVEQTVATVNAQGNPVLNAQGQPVTHKAPVRTISRSGQDRAAAEQQATRLTANTDYVWEAYERSDGSYEVRRIRDATNAGTESNPNYLKSAYYYTRTQAEAGLTGIVNGQPTVAYLQSLRTLAQTYTESQGELWIAANIGTDVAPNWQVVRASSVSASRGGTGTEPSAAGAVASDGTVSASETVTAKTARINRLIEAARTATEASQTIWRVNAAETGIEQILNDSGQPVLTAAGRNYLAAASADPLRMVEAAALARYYGTARGGTPAAYSPAGTSTAGAPATSGAPGVGIAGAANVPAVGAPTAGIAGVSSATGAAGISGAASVSAVGAADTPRASVPAAYSPAGVRGVTGVVYTPQGLQARRNTEDIGAGEYERLAAIPNLNLSPEVVAILQGQNMPQFGNPQARGIQQVSAYDLWRAMPTTGLAKVLTPQQWENLSDTGRKELGAINLSVNMQRPEDLEQEIMRQLPQSRNRTPAPFRF